MILRKSQRTTHIAAASAKDNGEVRSGEVIVWVKLGENRKSFQSYKKIWFKLYILYAIILSTKFIFLLI